MIPLILGEFYVMYGFSQFSQFSIPLTDGLFIPSEEALTEAAFLSFLAAIVFLAGRKLAGAILDRRSLFPWSAYPNPASISKMVAIPYAIMALFYVTIGNLWGWFPSILVRNIVNNLLNPELALLMLLFLYFQKPDRDLRLATRITVAWLFVLGLAGGMIEGIVAPIFNYFMSAYLWKGQVRWRWPIVFLVLYIILTPAKYEYRHLQDWGQAGQQVTTLRNRLETWKESLENVWSKPYGGAEAWQKSSARASNIVQFAQVIEWTPKFIPYNHGRGFSDALLFFVPRFIWKDKPDIMDLTTNRYAPTFHQTTREGTRTSSIGIFQPADGFWDWGIAGVFAYPFLYGFLISVVFLGVRNSRPQARLVGALFCITFFQGLVTFSNILASLASLFVFSWLVMKGLQSLTQVPVRSHIRRSAS